ATAFLASFWPMICSSRAATIALGVSLSLSTSACSPPLWGMDAWMFISSRMSGPASATSSGAAEAVGEALLLADDASSRAHGRAARQEGGRGGSERPPIYQHPLALSP